MHRIFLSVLLALAILFLALPAAADVAANGKIVVVLDPGHGGIDGGTDIGTRTEKEYDLSIANCIRDALLADGRFEVYMTRSDNDTYLKFLPRTLVAVEHHADLLLSIHCNSHTSPDPNGLMAYVSLVPEYNAKPLADRILDSISAAVGIGRGRADTRPDTGDSLGVYYWNSERQWDMPGEDSLGMTSDYYSMNTWCSKFGIPSIIVEHGYLSNAYDLALLDHGETLQQMAWAEAGAIISYYTDHEHVWGDVDVDYPSNCTMDGTCSARCTICGCRSGVNPLPSAPDEDETHYWRATASKAATCTEEGWIDYICQVSFNLNDKGYPCEVHSKKVAIPAREHSFYVTEQVPATCLAEGHVTEVCSVCGESRTTILPPLEHDWNDDGVCMVCGALAEYRMEDPDSCEHQWETVFVSPTCEEEGQEGRICTRCGLEEVASVPALGHDWEVQMEVKPTCTEEGYYRAKCTRCGELDQKRLPPVEHHYIMKEENGRAVWACEFCGQIESGDSGGRRSLLSLKEHPIVMAALLVIVLSLPAAIVAASIWRSRYRAAERERLEDLFSHRADAAESLRTGGQPSGNRKR